MIIRTKIEFDAAHVQPNDPGKCSRLHGHRYTAFIDIQGPIDPKSGYVVEYGSVKRFLLKHLIPDHKVLNNMRSLAQVGIEVTDPSHIWDHALDSPSIENLALQFGDLCIRNPIKEFLAPARVVQVTIWETPNFAATWKVA